MNEKTLNFVSSRKIHNRVADCMLPCREALDFFFCAKHAALNATVTGFDVPGSSAHWQWAGLGPRESRESVQPQSFVCSESCCAYKLICVSVHSISVH